MNTYFEMYVSLYKHILCSLEYLRQIAGPRTVPVELGSRYTDEDWSQNLMTLSDFIDQHVLCEVYTYINIATYHKLWVYSVGTIC